MNLLYLGKYKRRFLPVIDQVKVLPPGSKILELCFGDTYIAEFCKKNGYEWTGFDINRHFVERARKDGFNAIFSDVGRTEIFPKADICIIVGSFYHFRSQSYSILERILKATSVIIISEPVSNISNIQGLAGYFAKRAADAGNGDEMFRYNSRSLTEEIEQYSKRLKYGVTLVERYGKDLIIKLTKYGR